MAKCRDIDIVSHLEFLYDEQVNYDLNSKQQHIFINDIHVVFSFIKMS